MYVIYIMDVCVYVCMYVRIYVCGMEDTRRGVWCEVRSLIVYIYYVGCSLYIVRSNSYRHGNECVGELKRREKIWKQEERGREELSDWSFPTPASRVLCAQTHLFLLLLLLSQSNDVLYLCMNERLLSLISNGTRTEEHTSGAYPCIYGWLGLSPKSPQ